MIRGVTVTLAPGEKKMVLKADAPENWRVKVSGNTDVYLGGSDVGQGVGYMVYQTELTLEASTGAELWAYNPNTSYSATIYVLASEKPVIKTV